MTRAALALLLFALSSCASAPPLPGAVPADDWILPGETHFARLWKLTEGGENAEGYWSFAGDRIVFQRRHPQSGVDCDQIYLLRPGDEPELVSTGQGVTTCAYFMPGDRSVVFASTHARMEGCPPPVDFSEGYVWAIRPEYDLWTRDLDTGALTRLTDTWGYDAEATVSPRGDRMVFTSTRSGDLELWTCALDGSDPVQVTDAIGYDGGAFFSHDGKSLVFRSTAFTPGAEAQEQATYRDLLSNWKVRPHSMEIMLIDVDGTNRRQLTRLGRASFAPFFHPDDSKVIFSSNFHEEAARNFDLFSIPVTGGEPERITTYEGFDSFPMFSPDGRYLVFASNRAGAEPGETNLFVAEWQ